MRKDWTEPREVGWLVMAKNGREYHVYEHGMIPIPRPGEEDITVYWGRVIKPYRSWAEVFSAFEAEAGGIEWIRASEWVQRYGRMWAEVLLDDDEHETVVWHFCGPNIRIGPYQSPSIEEAFDITQELAKILDPLVNKEQEQCPRDGE